jgi:hypothetical protein
METTLKSMTKFSEKLQAEVENAQVDQMVQFSSLFWIIPDTALANAMRDVNIGIDAARNLIDQGNYAAARAESAKAMTLARKALDPLFDVRPFQLAIALEPDFNDSLHISKAPENTIRVRHQVQATTSNGYRNLQMIEKEDKTITWESSDKNVATVDKDGLITGVKRGAATITGTDLDGLKVTREIKVDYSPLQWILVIFLFGWLWL